MSSVVIFAEIKPSVPLNKIESWAKKHLKARGANNQSLELRIVSKTEIAKLNKLYLAKRGPTDVLSFPLDIIPGEKKGFVGTVVICDNVIKTQAKESSVSIDDEYRRMINHGIDHLMGIHHK